MIDILPSSATLDWGFAPDPPGRFIDLQLLLWGRFTARGKERKVRKTESRQGMRGNGRCMECALVVWVGNGAMVVSGGT